MKLAAQPRRPISNLQLTSTSSSELSYSKASEAEPLCEACACLPTSPVECLQDLPSPFPSAAGTDRAVSYTHLVAQPPGKRLQNVLLLSGGEKALTALALLIAVFRYQPSPFCILDEVDAPLDEANVGRFINMLREMGTETQFIVVTHNRKTMETGSVLYGVTMQEPGVSKLVSVRWDQAEAQAPVARAATNAA